MIVEFKKRESAISPTRSNASDAGLDVYFCPEDPEVAFAKIQPGQSARLSTGLTFGIPHGYMLQVCNRSSVAAKRNLVVGAHIVDSGYDGEVFIDFHNIGTEVQYIESGTKIAQLVMVPVVSFRARETKGDLYGEDISFSNRGDGALGSTDLEFSMLPLNNIPGF